MCKKFLIVFAATLFSITSFAQTDGNIFTDDDFGKAEFDLISEDLSAAFVHTTNSGGSSLGSLWGVEVGLVFGAGDSDNLRKVAEDISGEEQEDLKFLPYAGIIAGVALPFGIGADVSMIPTVDLNGEGSFGSFRGSLGWSITDMIPLVGSFSPVKITALAAHGSTDFDYETSFGLNSTEKADFNVTNTEFGLVAGFNFFILEPYLGLSTVRSKTELNASTDNAFVAPENRNRNFSASLSGTRTRLGVLFKLPLLRFGLEMSNYQGLNRYTGKLSFKI